MGLILGRHARSWDWLGYLPGRHVWCLRGVDWSFWWWRQVYQADVKSWLGGRSHRRVVLSKATLVYDAVLWVCRRHFGHKGRKRRKRMRLVISAGVLLYGFVSRWFSDLTKFSTLSLASSVQISSCDYAFDRTVSFVTAPWKHPEAVHSPLISCNNPIWMAFLASEINPRTF